MPEFKIIYRTFISKVFKEYDINNDKEEITEEITKRCSVVTETISIAGITEIKGPIPFLLKHRKSGCFLCIRNGKLELAMPSKQNLSKFLLHGYIFSGMDEEEQSRHRNQPINIIMINSTDNHFVQPKNKTTSICTAELMTKKGKPLKEDTSKIEGDDPRFFMVHSTGDGGISLESFLSKGFYLASEHNGREGDPRLQLYKLGCHNHVNSPSYGATFDLIPKNNDAEEYHGTLKEEYLRRKARVK
ncbi:unnamed protein product [Owenia fusiformis]|uniref:Uncharacterized protein n=1 Tax=Owenia fusiformis TaxID=6347 RepID=A0A8J1TTP9_OWEFU|nr:unnamed protein product [Owenia fusiformis]